MPEQTDETLLVLARRNETAFLLLFERHQAAIFRVACRLTNSVDAAEDITQECFLSLLSGPQRFDPTKGSLRTYLYAAARNLARKYYWLRNAELDLDYCLDDAGTDEAHEPASLLLQEELSQLVQRAIFSLPLPQREALILFQYEELPLEEIATVLGIEVGAVKSRLHRARSRLKRILTPYSSKERVDETVR
jgi:RNA polymerase sigma-70 factor, ECF subfamily